MYSNLRSLIFKIDPERAHFLAIQSLKLNLVSNIFDENKNDPILKTKLFNQDLDNPIGIAAGFDKNAEVYNPLFKLGFGFVEVGTVTPLKQYGNEKPRVFRLVEDQALINRLGFNNHGSDIILKELLKYKNHNNFRIFPSIRFEYYLTLLKNSTFIIGNSSSGIMEAPYYGISTINIGDRQKNRLKSKLIKNIPFNENEILKAVKFAKNRKILKRKFFGEGKAVKKIEKLLLTQKLWKISNQKNFIDII